MKRRILEAASVMLLLSLLLAASAVAGEYHVYACKTPTGAPAPTDGWTGSAKGNSDVYTIDSCPLTDGALVAGLGDQSTHTADYDLASWTFSAPPPEKMVNATLWRAGDADGGSDAENSYEFSIADPGEVGFLETCRYWSGCTAGLGDFSEPFSAANRVEASSNTPASQLSLSASCEGTKDSQCPSGHGDAEAAAADVDLYAADVLLEQAEGPSVGEVSGPLATESAVEAMSDVLFSASDPGAGIWEVTFSIDGKVVQSVVPNENQGRCKNVGQTTDGLAAFLYVLPCPRTESVDVGFDTTAVPNGVHHLVVSVLDPAQNAAVVLDRNITIDNPTSTVPVAPAGPTAPASSGDLTPPSPAVLAGPLLPAAPKPGATSTLPRRRRAHLTLRIEPRSVSGHGSIHISGRVLGGHIPRAGKSLALQARLPDDKWTALEVVRTGPLGRFDVTYPAEFLGVGHWQLRVLCDPTPNYPFASGASKIVPVRVSRG
jgi:hypothetical protein